LVTALEAVIHVDTHVVAWLYEGRIDLLPETAARLIEESEVVISPMVELELEYLHEIGRARVGSRSVIDELYARIGLRASRASFASIIEHARGITWTRDPFDRIIVATAMADDAVLLTRDETILAHWARARWDEKPSGRQTPRRRKPTKHR
jgi:PIN domain nuclease of toxin-antitoxin system